VKWRLGLCRQDIYEQAGDKPAPSDAWIGTFGTVEDAEAAVEAVNDGPYFRLLALRNEMFEETSREQC
jgi:hypothetical protein